MTWFGILAYVAGAIMMACIVENVSAKAHWIAKSAAVVFWPLIMCAVFVYGVANDIRRSGRGR